MAKNKIDYAAEIAYATFQKGIDDPVTWAIRNINLPKNIPWDFSERMWQIPILEDKSNHIVVKKAAQVGFTTVYLCKTLHWLNYHSATAMYTLPRRDDISDFVNTTLNPIIDHSPHLQSIIADTDSVRLKKFRTPTTESYFHLMEGSVEPRMIPVDILANDEVDRCDQNYLEIFRARLSASSEPRHFQFSTPTLPGFGVDKLFVDTTQNEWHVRCGFCNEVQHLDWESNFRLEPSPRYVCRKCESDLSPDVINSGKWIPLYPGRDTQGYHVTDMMMPVSRPPKMLLSELNTKMSKKNFYNLHLGMAFSSSSGSFTKELIQKKMFDSRHNPEIVPMSSDQYFLGADQGNDIHVVVARISGQTRKIVYANKILFTTGDWAEKIMALIRNYHIKFAVVDWLPNTHDARRIWKNFSSEDRVALCHYSEIEEPIRRDKDEGKVHVNKTEMFDGLRSEIGDGAWKFYGDYDGDDTAIKFTEHLANLRRDERANNAGIVKGVWVNAGPDHYAHALNYCRIATLLGSNVGTFKLIELDRPYEQEEQPNRMSSVQKVWGDVYEEEEITEGTINEVLLGKRTAP
jgi:hypothetical protein